MPSTFNLVRNSRVFFTTDVNASSGLLPTSGATISNANTFEIQVLDGFSFSQATQQQTIQINEAGNTPVRGQRSFNTQLDPVEFSFATYIRPNNNAGAIEAEELVLWNALLSSLAMETTGVTITTPASLTRATTATNTVILACASTNLNAGGIAIGDIVSVGGINASITNVTEWEGPAILTTITGTISTATSLTLTYLTAPSAAAGLTAVTTLSSVKLYKGAVGYQGSTVSNLQHAFITTANTNRNLLQKFGLYILVDNSVYGVGNCVLDQASIDFNIDGIAMVTWTGKGTRLDNLVNATISAANPAVFGGTGAATGTAKAKAVTGPPFITNKLSTMRLTPGIGGTGTAYNMALTGGNLTISNNVSYVIPATLGVVNQPIGYFTGTRSISGNVTAYLRTGSLNSGQVLQDILTANSAETKFKMQVEVGGLSNATRVEFKMNGAMLQVPTIETADVMTTTINFTAQGYDSLSASQAYDLENTNDLFISYYAGN